MSTDEAPVQPEEKEEKTSKGNPILGMVDGALKSVRKFLDQQKMLTIADELTYLAMRKSIDLLKSTFVPMKIDGIENIPEFKPAILCSIVEQPIELFLASGLTPRKVHFMVPAKMFSTPGLEPLLEAIGAYRSTESQDDMEPVQRTIQFLNTDKDLVAMIPLDTGDPERVLKSVAGVLKFAAGIPCPIVPFATTSLKGFKLGGSIGIKVGLPIEVPSNIKKDARYEMAQQLVDQIAAMKAELKAPSKGAEAPAQ
jgi:1-acyl-sn-glycerol-3-phosphate acyltransferase